MLEIGKHKAGSQLISLRVEGPSPRKQSNHDITDPLRKISALRPNAAPRSRTDCYILEIAPAAVPAEQVAG